jgi:hypothetical protein
MNKKKKLRLLEEQKKASINSDPFAVDEPEEANPELVDLFSDEELIPWKAEWVNMPEYSLRDLTPKFQVIVSFACESDLNSFSELIEQKIGTGKGRITKSVWFPTQEIGRYANKRYIEKA